MTVYYYCNASEMEKRHKQERGRLRQDTVHPHLCCCGCRRRCCCRSYVSNLVREFYETSGARPSSIDSLRIWNRPRFHILPYVTTMRVYSVEQEEEQASYRRRSVVGEKEKLEKSSIFFFPHSSRGPAAAKRIVFPFGGVVRDGRRRGQSVR